MNSLNWWQNWIGELFGGALVCGFLYLFSWLRAEPAPLWAYYLAVVIGSILWSRPSYNRLKDFYKA